MSLLKQYILYMKHFLPWTLLCYSWPLTWFLLHMTPPHPTPHNSRNLVCSTASNLCRPTQLPVTSATKHGTCYILWVLPWWLLCHLRSFDSVILMHNRTFVKLWHMKPAFAFPVDHHSQKMFLIEPICYHYYQIKSCCHFFLLSEFDIRLF